MNNKALTLIRVFHNLKQKELAQSLGVSSSHLSEIESGKKTATLDLLQKYADYFRIPVSSLLYFSEHMEGRRQEQATNPIAIKALKMLEWFDAITRDQDDQHEREVSS